VRQKTFTFLCAKFSQDNIVPNLSQSVRFCRLCIKHFGVFWVCSVQCCGGVIVDGGWSSWSVWRSCVYVEEVSSSDHCLCRSRSCDNPPRRDGGRPCHGRNIEVSNCTCKQRDHHGRSQGPRGA